MSNGFSGKYTHVQVFSATMEKGRNALGSDVAAFIAAKKPEIVHTTVTQSSDNQFHCYAITLFYNLAK